MNSFYLKIRKNIILTIKSKLFVATVLTVFVVGLLAHAYRFFRIDLNYDYLSEFYASNGRVIYHRIELGRFLSPIIYVIRGSINAPWIIAIFAFIYISISSFLIVRFFDRERTFDAILISSFLTVNITLTVLISTFLHDFDIDMLALLFSTIAALIWKKSNTFIRCFLMVPFLVISMGLYQSYAAVCFGLIFMYSMIRLVQGGTIKSVMTKLFFGLVMVIISMFFYYGLAQLICFLTQIPLQSRVNAIDLMTNNMFLNLYNTYRDWVHVLFVTDTVFGKVFNVVFHSFILTILFVFLCYLILSKKIPALSKMLIIAMGILLPFAVNYTEFLSGSYFSLVMFYPTTALIFPFIYLFILEIYRMSESREKSVLFIFSKLMTCLIVVQLFLSTITSNIVYVKKETESSATFAYLNRVVYTIEHKDGYVPGETEVAIFGGHKMIGLQDGYEGLSYITGARTMSSLGSTYQCYYLAYFEYVIKVDIAIVDDNTLRELSQNQTVIDMPCYPNANSLQFVGDILVVKLDDVFF